MYLQLDLALQIRLIDKKTLKCFNLFRNLFSQKYSILNHGDDLSPALLLSIYHFETKFNRDHWRRVLFF